jgi:hypothetical protein
MLFHGVLTHERNGGIKNETKDDGQAQGNSSRSGTELSGTNGNQYEASSTKFV